MIRSLIPLILIVAAVGIFVGPTRAAMRDIEPLSVERSSLEGALLSSQKLLAVRDTLQEQYNSFKGGDLARLQKLVPSHVDNVRLVIDINAMASAYGMLLKNIAVQQINDPTANPGVGAIKSDNPENLGIHFTVSGSYSSLKAFLNDLGRSLRLVDITDISFEAREKDSYDFSVNLRTYWLQDK